MEWKKSQETVAKWLKYLAVKSDTYDQNRTLYNMSELIILSQNQHQWHGHKKKEIVEEWLRRGTRIVRGSLCWTWQEQFTTSLGAHFFQTERQNVNEPFKFQPNIYPEWDSHMAKRPHKLPILRNIENQLKIMTFHIKT